MRRLQASSAERKAERRKKRGELSSQREKAREQLRFFEHNIPYMTPDNQIKWIDVETLALWKGIDLSKAGYSRLEAVREEKIEETKRELALINRELEALG
jgi:hypothetical protein